MASRYDTLPLAELQTLRARFIAALVRPNVANRAAVEVYLADVERALRAVAAAEMATTPSVHEMRSGTRRPRNAADRERLQWSHWS